MLYPKEPSLSAELFRHPTAAYRAAPFWAWNCKLEKETLDRQMPVFQEMGMGGFHMHVRTGLDTPYLSDEFMERIRQCVDWAAAHDMRAYLYDEDRWPSGAAAGMVTEEERFRAQYLLFTPELSQQGKLLAVFDVRLDRNGCLAEYAETAETEPCPGRWFAYRCYEAPRGRFNGHSYVDTLNPEATRRFLSLTHERYAAVVGEAFGSTVPAIFTDEPQFSRKQQLRFATEKAAVRLSWTESLPKTFAEVYGDDLTAHLPELIWELPEGRVSQLRYQYHEHVAERFSVSYADVLGAWCAEHGLLLTGHMMEEPTLESQTSCLGEAMRSYRSFTLPGIDMLCSRREYTTAKQCQSAAHQYGREGMMSELYGVTGWSFDFRGHKLLGDWQAALGVTLRVPHLSWMSMEGDAKRDYPASIFFQSPWYREYPLIEDHFARVNTALTRGKPLVHVAVIHPIESYWLHWGPMDQTAAVREQMEAHFQQVTEWLLFGGIDFDFLCESLLPELCPTGGAPLKVGEMTYDAVIVPGCETLRSTTLERLEAFRQAGGRLIFLAEAPTLENGALSRRGKALWERSVHVAMERTLLLDALSPLREVELRDASSGQMTKHLLHQLRQDGDGRWLFIANGKEPYNLDISSRMSLRIILRGKWKPTLWNTLDGSTVPVPHHTEKETTIVEVNLYDCDSLLFHLEPVESSAYVPDECVRPAMQLTVPPLAALRLEEPNVLLMDQAMYALDNEQWQPTEELLRIRQKLHRRLGWKTNEWQPWRLPTEKPEHTIRLRFRFHCAQAMSGCRLAMEKRGEVSLWLDGQPIVPIENGWYVDPCIKTSELPCLSAGSHTLEVIRPFTPRTCLEWVYLLGNFRVKLSGRLAMLEPVQEEKAGYASLTEQGIPFYGGNASYVFDIETHGGALRLRVPQWRGALIAASIDGQDVGRIAFPPYSIETSPLPAGMHQICLKLFGTRANTFGPLHLADEKETWIGPGAWCSGGDAWTYEYRLKPFGILSSSQVEEIEGSVRKSCARNQHG